jgi:hypothetical protein
MSGFSADDKNTQQTIADAGEISLRITLVTRPVVKVVPPDASDAQLLSSSAPRYEMCHQFETVTH